MNKMILEELTENKELLRIGEGGSTSGSDSAPSDDNLPQSMLNKNLPPIEKQNKTKKETIEKKTKTQNKVSKKAVDIPQKNQI